MFYPPHDVKKDIRLPMEPSCDFFPAKPNKHQADFQASSNFNINAKEFKPKTLLIEKPMFTVSFHPENYKNDEVSSGLFTSDNASTNCGADN